MDLDDFIAAVAPARVRSRLAPHHAGIGKLHALGYTDAQVQAWLASVGVVVSRQTVQQYIRRHGIRSHAIAPAAPISAELPAPASAPVQEIISRRERREQMADEFMPVNPFLDRKK